MADLTEYDTMADIEFFEQKLANAKTPEEKAKLEKQLEILRDASIVYQIGRGIERRSFKIDVGHLSKEEAMEYIEKTLAEHKAATRDSE